MSADRPSALGARAGLDAPGWCNGRNRQRMMTRRPWLSAETRQHRALDLQRTRPWPQLHPNAPERPRTYQYTHTRQGRSASFQKAMPTTALIVMLAAQVGFWPSDVAGHEEMSQRLNTNHTAKRTWRSHNCRLPTNVTILLALWPLLLLPRRKTCPSVNLGMSQLM